MFLYLDIFCCLYLVQDSFTDYLLCVSSVMSVWLVITRGKLMKIVTMVRPGLYPLL